MPGKRGNVQWGHKKRVKADSIKCQLLRLATGLYTSLVWSQQTLPHAVNLSCFPFLLPSRYVCRCRRAQEGKQRLIHQNMICRVFCYGQTLPSIYNHRHQRVIKRIRTTALQEECDFQTNISALLLHSKCLEEGLPAHSGKSTSICWIKEKGGGGLRNKWFHHNLLSISFMLALRYGVLES